MTDRIVSVAARTCGRCGQVAVVELAPEFLDGPNGKEAYRIIKCQACKRRKEIHHESWLGLEQEAMLFKGDRTIGTPR